MKDNELKAIRAAALENRPFHCGGLTWIAVPFDESAGVSCCYECEVECLCSGDIAEMCDYVNTRRGYDEFIFKLLKNI